ncbi:helix-turn-helix domain-containing protein [Microvirga alba]|uniref:Helix-turn-helix domain-containing protein n=1 Tax=Microvirga alba TaxID=2791025 RepID=A0A931BMG1_9HYPH|nr:helix-turn-helix domain-containing protein [Microvirga alba]
MSGRALVRARGNVSEAAAALHVSRATLHRKMKRLGIRRK